MEENDFKGKLAPHNDMMQYQVLVGKYFHEPFSSRGDLPLSTLLGVLSPNPCIPKYSFIHSECAPPHLPSRNINCTQLISILILTTPKKNDYNTKITNNLETQMNWLKLQYRSGCLFRYEGMRVTVIMVGPNFGTVILLQRH